MFANAVWLALEMPQDQATTVETIVHLATPASRTDSNIIENSTYSHDELKRRQSAKSVRFLRIERPGRLSAIVTRVERFVGYLKKDHFWTRDCAGCEQPNIPLGPSHALCRSQMKMKGGEFGECGSGDKHDFVMSILEGESLPFCDLKFGAVRDWLKIARISNHLKVETKGGMPVANFLRLLESEYLRDATGIDEISRFCIINAYGDVCHYSNTTDEQGKITFPSPETVQNLKQNLSI